MKLEELKKLEQAATPGPWGAASIGGGKYRLEYDLRAQGKHWDQDDEAFSNGGWKAFSPTNEPDARFIAAARNMLPKLIAALEAAQKLRDKMDDWYTDQSALEEYVDIFDVRMSQVEDSCPKCFVGIIAANIAKEPLVFKCSQCGRIEEKAGEK